MASQTSMKNVLAFAFLFSNFSAYAQEIPDAYQPTKANLQIADGIARQVSAWFQYTTGRMDTEHLGQCGDYAVQFILKYNEYAGQNVARLVTANNPLPSGTYRLGEKTDVGQLGFHGFRSGTSGFLIWKGQLYIYHPILGAYPLFLEKLWTPKIHFGVNMLNKEQVHTWVSIGDVSVDPTYSAL